MGAMSVIKAYKSVQKRRSLTTSHMDKKGKKEEECMSVV